MSLERETQTTFGWLVAADMFLGGTGAACFLVSFIMRLLNKYEPIAKVGAVSGTVLVLIGVLFLIAELGNKRRFYRLFANINPSSWMSRGTWILTIFIIFSLGYSLPAFKLFALFPWSSATTLGEVIGMVAAISSVLAIIYTGFLFGVIKRIPFWNTPALPLLFLFSSLYTGIAILLLIAPFFEATSWRETVAALHTLMIAEIVLILMQLLVLGGYLEIASHVGVSAAESIRLLKTPLFIVGVVITGLIVPLGLLSYSASITSISTLFALGMIAAVLALISGMLLRYAIIRAGVYLRLY